MQRRCDACILQRLQHDICFLNAQCRNIERQIRNRTETARKHSSIIEGDGNWRRRADQPNTDGLQLPRKRQQHSALARPHDNDG
jgi:hypothetical protein